MGKVVEMNDAALDQLATDIRREIERREESREAWIEATLNLGQHIAEAKKRLPNTKRFGAWWVEQGFKLDKTDRAICIRLADNPEEARELLESSKGKSLQWIARKRLLSTQKSETEQKPHKKGWIAAVLDSVAAPKYGLKGTGLKNKKAKFEQIVGYEIPSHFTDVENERKFVGDFEHVIIPQVFPDADPEPAPVILATTSQQKLDTAIRQATRRLELEMENKFQQRVHEHLRDVLLPIYREKCAAADRIIKSRRGIMTRPAYKKILSCLHPDRVTDEGLKARYTDAFNEFRKLELVLCSEAEMPMAKESDLPATVEELLKRKKMRAA